MTTLGPIVAAIDPHGTGDWRPTMNPYRSTDLAKSYRAHDIEAANDRRQVHATDPTKPTRTDMDPAVVGQPSRVSLTVRRFILRSA